MSLINPKRDALMRLVDISKYQTFTANAVLSGIGATAEAVIEAKNTHF